ncbi:MAG: addiction module toxin, HicA family [Proteobacteria bacterium]|nr:addiction module toxin, HicA family [Pseudomonadota bacterium]NDB22324.1 addiction module toxin, HicA family [Pseudomonadota bacterium]NDE08744.1 addiction module toxin, HicA family [Chloroflexota bacterium]
MPTTPTQWCLIGRLNADGSILRRVTGSHEVSFHPMKSGDLGVPFPHERLGMGVYH